MLVTIDRVEAPIPGRLLLLQARSPCRTEGRSSVTIQGHLAGRRLSWLRATGSKGGATRSLLSPYKAAVLQCGSGHQSELARPFVGSLKNWIETELYRVLSRNGLGDRQLRRNLGVQNSH
jgi:hypothetical protein